MKPHQEGEVEWDRFRLMRLLPGSLEASLAAMLSSEVEHIDGERRWAEAGSRPPEQRCPQGLCTRTKDGSVSTAVWVRVVDGKKGSALR